MTIGLFRRFRGLAIALVVLGLSAGAVFAAAPVLNLAGNNGANGRDQAPGLNKGDQGEAEQGDDAEDESGEEAAEDEDAEDGAESEEAEAPDVEAEGASEDNHGALVSEAAQLETPDGFVNHGAFVSCVAKMKDAAAADFDWTTVTPEACAEADAARDAARAEKHAAKLAAKGTHGKGAEKRPEHAGGRR